MVCTGNICRSPSAEAVLRQKLVEAGLEGRVTVDSAGTDAYHVGEAPSRLAVECAEARGYDLRALRARVIRPEDFDRFEMILAMDRGHLGILTGMKPDAPRGQLQLLMRYAPGAVIEVPDPFYGGRQDYEHALDLIESAMPGLIETLRRTCR